MEPALPEGWIEQFDLSTNKKYYANTTTGETQWTPPTPTVSAPAAAPSPVSSSAGLPEGWMEQSDPSTGRKYYCNTKTGQTQWEMPTSGGADMPPARPPPAAPQPSASAPATTESYRAPGKVDLSTLMSKDAEDESLQRYKRQLLGAAATGAVAAAAPSALRFLEPMPPANRRCGCGIPRHRRGASSGCSPDTATTLSAFAVGILPRFLLEKKDPCLARRRHCLFAREQGGRRGHGQGLRRDEGGLPV